MFHKLERHSDGYVFHGAKGARLRAKRVLDIFKREIRNFKREIRNALKTEFPVACGENGFAQGTIHSFRHYFLSEAFRQGATEAEIKDWVGHRSSEWSTITGICDLTTVSGGCSQSTSFRRTRCRPAINLNRRCREKARRDDGRDAAAEMRLLEIRLSFCPSD